MGEFFKSLLTGKDKLTWDVARVLLFFGGIVFLACTVISVLKTMQFDMEKFGYGLGFVFNDSGGKNYHPNNLGYADVAKMIGNVLAGI